MRCLYWDGGLRCLELACGEDSILAVISPLPVVADAHPCSVAAEFVQAVLQDFVFRLAPWIEGHSRLELASQMSKRRIVLVQATMLAEQDSVVRLPSPQLALAAQKPEPPKPVALVRLPVLAVSHSGLLA